MANLEPNLFGWQPGAPIFRSAGQTSFSGVFYACGFVGKRISVRCQFWELHSLVILESFVGFLQFIHIYIYIAYWVIIYHLPPLKGTRNSC